MKCLLPKPDAALVKLNLSIDGELDFPNKMFSMDAALHDSVINGFPVSGQMAMRVSWGNQPNFVFSIGGFHPAYTPPPNFPKLQPMTLDLGSDGAAKISVSGFFAVTSNTVQVGRLGDAARGRQRHHADASVSVKALFVFQPFSFEADIDASVKISFHGYGPSVHLSGTLDGPSPWHIKGEVCVSIIWWDACLGFDVTFGGDQQITQPAIDPWSASRDRFESGDHRSEDCALRSRQLVGSAHPRTVSSVTRRAWDRHAGGPGRRADRATEDGPGRDGEPADQVRRGEDDGVDQRSASVQATLGTPQTVKLHGGRGGEGVLRAGAVLRHGRRQEAVVSRIRAIPGRLSCSRRRMGTRQGGSTDIAGADDRHLLHRGNGTIDRARGDAAAGE